MARHEALPQWEAPLFFSYMGDCNDGEVGGMNGFWQGKPKYSEKNCPDATFVHHKSHLPNPGRRGGKPATNRFRYGAAPFKRQVTS
jgi:hypothetical protein